VDGLRVDAVASMLYLDFSRLPDQWVPNALGGRENLEAVQFLKRFNEICYERFPGIMTIAEDSTAWPGVCRPTYLGGLGFGFKWNLGWMHDSLPYLSREPLSRRHHQGEAAFSLAYAFDECFVLVLSHDEVVHGKGSLLNRMPNDPWQKFANPRMFYGWMYGHPGKKLLFMGEEFGQTREWNHDAGLDWHLLDLPRHAGLRRLVQRLNRLYKSEPALWEQDDGDEGFQWLDFQDAAHCVLAFLRKAKSGPPLVFVVNAAPSPWCAYRIGVPGAGWYQEVLNSDAELYGGSNLGNGGVHADPISWHGQSHSLSITLPLLATVAFRRHPYGG
jgi:1,4-alpha-glucan branching enzyme